jgi:hypothetical protein
MQDLPETETPSELCLLSKHGEHLDVPFNSPTILILYLILQHHILIVELPPTVSSLEPLLRRPS